MEKDSLFSTVAVGFELPLEMLEACHERVQAQLQTLNRLGDWLPGHGADPEAQRAAVHLLHYFDSAAVNHHIDEEDDLCPRLLRRAADGERAALQRLVDWMKQDHRRLAALWQELRVPLSVISQGTAAELPSRQVEAFTQGYLCHIERENSELLPCARRLLTEQDKVLLTQTMTARRRYRP